MKIEKLPSGSYRARKMYQGKIYSVVFEYKPTQKEALQAIAAELNKVKTKYDWLIFRGAAGEYVAMKRNVLSPKTIKEYAEMSKRFPDWFNNLLLSEIS